MTNTATTTTATYRKTKTGEWVVFAPAAALSAHTTVTVSKRDGRTKVEHIARVGRSFDVGGVDMAYGYIGASAAPARSSSFSPRRRRSCITGGNCSSFGTSRSCGADDCDGF